MKSGTPRTLSTKSRYMDTWSCSDLIHSEAWFFSSIVNAESYTTSFQQPPFSLKVARFSFCCLQPKTFSWLVIILSLEEGIFSEIWEIKYNLIGK